ncbi:MAG: methylated-DNA--[protein]-cysteine S-methyltransferase [Planctomycetota bacterium]
MPIHTLSIDSPLGTWTLHATPTHLTRLTPGHTNKPSPDRGAAPAVLNDAAERLAVYLAGQPVSFDDLPLAPAGTPFQQRVWAALRQIPRGQTRTYGRLARELGQPTAARAVGAANARNPIPVLIPCHRVIAATGKLQGFALGLDLKQKLLDLEQAPARARQSPLLPV